MSIRRISPLPGEDAPSGGEASGVDDVDLMRHIVSGSQHAFAQLYDATCAQVFGLIIGVVGRREAADQVLQDTFMHVWSRASEFAAHRGTVRSWIAGIAHRRAVAHVRALDESSTITLLPEPQSPSVAALPQEQGRCLTLAYYAGLTQQQVAAHTGLSLASVRAHTRAGLSRVRDDLRPIADVPA